MARKWTRKDLTQVFEALIECNSDLTSHPAFRGKLDRNRNLFANQITREANGNIAYRSVDFSVRGLNDADFWKRIDSTPYHDLIEENAAVAMLKMAEKTGVIS